MKIDILTLFPDMFTGVFDQSMIRIARDRGIVSLEIHDLRRWTYDNHRTADDKAYGGGPGMVMKVEPVDRALEDLRKGAVEGEEPLVILMTPQGQRFDQARAKALAARGHIIIIAGHYEGYDERIRSLVDTEVSMGDYILTCGEIPAMAVCDSVIRLLPGVLGDRACLVEESFEEGLLEYPQYTRPYEYKGLKVPDILLSGDPVKISAWRRQQALMRTRERRPDLLET